MNRVREYFSGWSNIELLLLGVVVALCTIVSLVALTFFYIARSPADVATEGTPTLPVTFVTSEPGDQGSDFAGPTITLSPDIGSPGSTVTVQGEGWPAQSRVIIYLVPENPPRYAVNSAVAGADGRFSVDIIVPSDPRWLAESPVPVLAQSDDAPQGSSAPLSAQALLNISNPIDIQLTPTPATGPTLSPAPLESTPTLPPPPPGVARLTTTVNVT
jgi:hypothetical protein